MTQTKIMGTDLESQFVMSSVPTFAWLQSSGNLNYTGGGTNLYSVMSGVSFMSGVGANFTVTAGNPHMVTYIGSSPIYGNIEANASSFFNIGVSARIAILKNGVTSFSGNAPYMTYGITAGACLGNVSRVMLINSGDYFQVGIYGAGNSTQYTDSMFQIAITRLVY
jgi:hypothetical protein